MRGKYQIRPGERGLVLKYKFSLTPADRGEMPAPCRSWRTQEKVIFQDLTLRSPLGITTPSAKRGKSWSNTRNGSLVYNFPSR